MKYYCANCEEFFDEEEIVKRPNTLNYCDTEWHCPHCHEECIHEANECKKCGEPITDYGLCEDCKLEVYKSWKAFKDTLTEAELEYLYEVIEDDE